MKANNQRTGEPISRLRAAPDSALASEAAALIEESDALRPQSVGAREALWRRIEDSTAEPPTRRFSFMLVASLGSLVGAAAVGAAILVATVHRPLASPSAPSQVAQQAPSPSLSPSGPSPGTGTAPAVLDLGAVGTVSTAQGARVRMETDPRVAAAGETRLYLDAGSIQANIVHHTDGSRFVVVTPDVRVIDVGTQFTVRVVPGGGTRVDVSEGEVRVEGLAGTGSGTGATGAVEVRGGEHLESSDPRLATAPLVAPKGPAGLAPTLVASAPPSPVQPTTGSMTGSTTCPSTGDVATRRDCYTRAAAGEGIPAQNALYALAVLERDESHDLDGAVRDFTAYGSRFPDGVLAQEAAVGAIDVLLEQGRYTDARARADAYLTAFPQGAKASDIALIRADLLCEQLGQADQALAAYASLAAPSQPSLVRDEAEYRRAGCLYSIRRNDEAASSLQTYLSDFPQGAHADEARQHLSGAH
jgi:TolA-binding protein/ferric-dicitrate binding protein FerR (iron transport regulator)